MHPNGKKYIIPDNTFIPTSLEGKEGRFRYILFIGSDKTRFEAPQGATSSDFVAATYKNKQWSYYIDDDTPRGFTVNDNDCIIAKIKEYERNDEGTGIKSVMVYSDSRDSVFDALTNGGEVQGLYMKDGLVMLNAEFVKTGKLASVNNKSEFDLDRGTFRLGGTGTSDYKLYFDGTDLYMGEGAIKWSNLDDQSKTNLKGEQGNPGKDAPIHYTWVRYADNASGAGMSASPDGKKYIGLAYNKTTSTPSNNASDYSWVLIKGADGIPGQNGQNGITYYTWIRYADNAVGAGMSASPDGKKYLGIGYNKPTNQPSSNPGDYIWSLIKGADGGKGDKGDTGDTGNSVAIIYRRELIKPSTPSGATPSGWSTNSSNAPGTGMLWMSQGIKTPGGSLVGSWTEPVQLEVSTTNLLHNHKWTLGQGQCGIFRPNQSTDSENVRMYGDTPFGRGIIWRGMSNDGDSTSKEGPDGGWTADIEIDHTRGYMLSVWAKQTNPGGSIYFGPRTGGDTTDLGNQAVSNPYFWSGDLPVMNKWYLLVGFLNASNDPATSGTGKGGVYDPTTGEKVISFVHYKIKDGATHQSHRSYYFYDADASGTHYVDFFAPRFDILDGTEPTITDLLGMSPQLDWVKDWNGTKTEIGGTQVLAPKIFAGTKESNGSATGVAMGTNVFGTGSNYSGIAGYKAGLKTFHLKTDGSAVFGTRAGNQLIVNTDGSVDTPNINASKVTAGILKATNNKSSINLDNGNMNLGTKDDSSYLIYENGQLNIKLAGKNVATSGDVENITQIIENNNTSTKHTFQSIGVGNMLPNSDFIHGINRKPFSFDYTYLRWDSQAGGSESIDVWSGSSEQVPNGKRALVVEGGGYKLTNGACNLPIRAGFDCPKFIVTPGERYNVSMLYSGHRLESITIECLCYDKDGNRIMGDNHSKTFPCTKWGGKEIENWDKAEMYFHPQENAAFCCIRVYKDNARIDINKNDSNTTYLFILDPMVNAGPLLLDYTAKTAEAYIGSTEITQDGLKVSMANGVGPQGYAALSSQGLELFDSSNDRYAWFGDSKTAFIDSIQANHIFNKHLIKWAENRPIDYYIAPTASGDGSGRDSNNKSNSINRTLNWIRENYGCYSYRQDLRVHIEPGDYYEDVYVGGWIGTGIIKILFHGDASLHGTIVVEENTMLIDLKGGRSGWDTNNGCVIYAPDTAITVRHSVCNVDGFRSRPSHYPNYGGTFVRATCGSKVLIGACDVVKYWHFAFGEVLSFIHLADNRGDVQQIAGDSFNCTYYLLGTNRPIANSGVNFINCWNTNVVEKPGTAVNSAWIPKDTAPPPPPTPTWQWFEQSFSLYSLRTVPEGSGSGTSGRDGEWGQGKWGSYKPHRGYAEMGDGPANWCHGGRNFTIWLTLTRLNTSHGYGGAVPVPKLRQPDGSTWDCGVAFARGDTKTIQLPASIANAIANGQMKTLQMWAGVSTNDYSFYNNSSIRIRCEKPV